MVAGLEDITSGDLMIDGKRVNDVPPSQRNIGMVFQSYALYPHMTVYDNVKFPLTNLNVIATKKASKILAYKKIAELIEYHLDEINKIYLWWQDF